MTITLEVAGRNRSAGLLVARNAPEMALHPRSLPGCVFGAWGNSGALPKNPLLPRMLTEQTLRTSRDDSAFLRVCGFNFESTLF